MRKSSAALLFPVCLALLSVGCGTSYAWRSSVPRDMRTVSVPTFSNETDVMEIGPLMTRQVLREFQREGSFSIDDGDNAAIEVQGVVKRVHSGAVAYSRRAGHRMNAYEMVANVEVSIVDRRSGRVLVDGRVYKASATFTAGQDIDTAERDAAGRLAEDLARQVVDDVLCMDIGSGKQTEGKVQTS